MPETSVRIGELAATRDPGLVLVSVGLGSCIGLAMLDRARGVAGMAHVMLPRSDDPVGSLPGRFANHAVPVLLAEVVRLGASRSALEVVIAGGASMFSSAQAIDVGRRNRDAVVEAVLRAGLPLTAADTGGDKGRTMRVFSTDGRVTVRAVGSEERMLLGEAQVTAAAATTGALR